MSRINYAELRGEDRGAPADGNYDAWLARARLQMGESDFVVTEWQVDNLYWESLNGFEGRRMTYTQELLDGLGIDRAKIMSDADLSNALDDASEQVYRVRVEQNGRFINTYVLGRVESDAPIDAGDLPKASASAAPSPAEEDDDEIPF